MSDIWTLQPVLQLRSVRTDVCHVKPALTFPAPHADGDHGSVPVNLVSLPAPLPKRSEWRQQRMLPKGGESRNVTAGALG